MTFQHVLVSLFFLMGGSSFAVAIYFYIVKGKKHNGFATKLVNKDIALGVMLNMFGVIVLFDPPYRYLVATLACVPYIVYRYIFIRYIFKQLQ